MIPNVPSDPISNGYNLYPVLSLKLTFLLPVVEAGVVVVVQMFVWLPIPL